MVFENGQQSMHGFLLNNIVLEIIKNFKYRGLYFHRGLYYIEHKINLHINRHSPYNMYSLYLTKR